MKAKWILVLLIAQLSGLHAGFDLDSLRRQAFKPLMGHYLRQVDELCDKISNSQNKHLIRHYSKELMELSDDMELTVNQYFGYKAGGSRFYPALVLGNTISYVYVLSFYNSTGSVPVYTAKVNKIYDQASYVRFLNTASPAKVKQRIAKIKGLVTDLRLLSF